MLFTAASSNVFNPQSVYDHTENLNNEMNDEVTIFTYAFGEGEYKYNVLHDHFNIHS